MMIRFLALWLVMTLGPTAIARTTPAAAIPSGTVVPLWPKGEMPGPGADRMESRNLPPPGGLLQVTDVSRPTLAIFKPQGARGPTPAMIICPGGSYTNLSYNWEGTEIAAWLNRLGITGLVLKYRVPDNREGAFQDIQRAFRVTRLHAAEWGIDPDKLGVIGFSAGGHLAAKSGANSGEASYAALDAADQLSCRPDFVVLVYPAFLSLNCKLAPDLVVTSKTPMTLIVHNRDDINPLIGSRVYEAALTAARVPHRFLLYATGGHGYALHSYKAVRVWPIAAAKWLRRIGIL